MRRFRPGPIRRWAPALHVPLGVGLAWLFHGILRPAPEADEATLDVWSGAALLCSGWSMWNLRELVRAWSSVVEIDAARIRWSDDEGGHALRWEEIERVEESGPERDPVPALLLKTGARYALPFASRALYRELRGRLNPLPPETERRMGVD